MQLQFEIRSISQFQNVTRVLANSAGGVDIQLGKDMGIKKGDEYAIFESDNLEGFVDEREVGLILIKDVGSTRSKGTILFSSIPVVKDVQLREIPRLGADLAVYGHNYVYVDGVGDNDTSFVVGARGEATRGFYNIRPYAAIQAIVDLSKWIPLNVIGGVQYSLFLRRLEFGGRAGFAGGSNALVKILEENFSSTDDPWFTQLGISGGAYASYLFSRDFKFFIEAQFDYLFGLTEEPIFGSYGGYQIGLGASFKL